MRLRRLVAWQWRSAIGAELIEFALVLPILLLVFAGIVDFALGFQRYLVVVNAAREGARIASLPGYGAGDVTNRVTDYLRQGTGDATLTPGVTSCLASVSVGTGPNVSAARVVVQTNYSFPFLGPVAQLVTGGAFGSMNLGARSTMRVEAGSTLPACTGP
jgi:Flp pilus assembly protein TadG